MPVSEQVYRAYHHYARKEEYFTYDLKTERFSYDQKAHVGACPVYGYRKSEENRNQLVVDEYAARVVRDIFRAKIDGRSAKRIADELNTLGVLSPLAYKINRGLPHPKGGFADRPDAKWSATTVIRILQDEIYTGTLVQGRQGTYNHKLRNVIQIFAWAADGVPLNQMVKRLNEAGILTPSRYKASCGLIKHENLMGSGVWQTMTVTKILSDAVYTGDMVQGKTTAIGHKQVPTPPEDRIIVRGTHEPLVSRELFEQARAARERAARKYTRTTKTPYSENILRGRIFCGCCGKPLHRQRSKSKNRNDDYFYRCISNDRIQRDACQRPVSVREDRLLQTILTIIRKEAEVVMGNSLRLKQHSGQLEQDKAGIGREIAKLRQSAADSRKYLTSLYENLVSGTLTAEEYHTLKANYEGRINAAAQRVRELQHEQAERTAQVAEYISIADRLACISKDSKLSALLVEQLIERITVNGPGDIEVQFRFESGFERVAEVLENE